MELCTALIAYMRGQRNIKLMHPQSFLNVSQAQNIKTFWAIFVIKCLISGYGTKYTVPKGATTAMFIANIASVCILEVSGDVGVVIAYNIAAAVAMLLLHDNHVAIVICCWAVSSLDFNHQFLLDVCTVMTVLIYVFNIYGREYEKAVTLICAILCLDWCFDNYHSRNPVTFGGVLVTLAFQGGLFLALQPLRRQFFERYEFICECVLVYSIFKYFRIASVSEMPDNPATYSPEVRRSYFRHISELVEEWLELAEKIFFDAQTFLSEMSMRKITKYVSKSPETGNEIITVILDMNNVSSEMEFYDI